MKLDFVSEEVIKGDYELETADKALLDAREIADHKA